MVSKQRTKLSIMPTLPVWQWKLSHEDERGCCVQVHLYTKAFITLRDCHSIGLSIHTCYTEEHPKAYKVYTIERLSRLFTELERGKSVHNSQVQLLRVYKHAGQVTNQDTTFLRPLRTWLDFHYILVHTTMTEHKFSHAYHCIYTSGHALTHSLHI